MIAQTLSILLLAAVAAAGVTKEVVESSTWVPIRPFEGIDPHTLSCDPEGHIFLLLPHYVDCSKFYMCAHGDEIEFNCAPGLYFDFEEQTCNWPSATQCWLREVKEEEEEEGSGFREGELGLFGEEIENGPLAILTAESSGTVRPLSPLAARLFNGIMNCNKADAAAKQVAYKGDCQRYWKCANGIPQAVYCSDGLFFNELTQQCDFEANVKCNVVVEDELQGEFLLTQ